MQPSLFNVRVALPEHRSVFLLNTFTDAQAIVPQDVAALLDRLGSTGPRDLTRDEWQSLRELAENGFIVPDQARERETVEAYFRDVRLSTDTLRVTVLTTLQCNFACDYCFQGDHDEANQSADRMSMETAERVGDWLEDQLNEVRPKTLSMLFFGGEPLLNLPVLYYLSERMEAACSALGVKISISVITNGLLLTRQFVERLLPLGLSGIKVTLDGDRETHDKMRPLRGGQGTFDKIIRNIREVADLCPIGIGGNFDEKTVESYPALLQFLRDQDFAAQIAQVSFKPIIRAGAERRGDTQALKVIPLTLVGTDGPAAKPLNGTCMTVAGAGVASACDACNLLDEKMSWLREETARHGFETVDGVHMGPCEIHRAHSHTVGPDGSLYACPGFTGERSQAVGHIDGRHLPRYARTASAFEQLAAWKECNDCAFIPVCAGGCTVAAHAEFGDINKPNCHKTSFEQGVAAMARDAAAATLAPPALAS